MISSQVELTINLKRLKTWNIKRCMCEADQPMYLKVERIHSKWSIWGGVCQESFLKLIWLICLLSFLLAPKQVMSGSGHLISWLQSPSAVTLEPPKIKSDAVSTVSPSISHEVTGPDAMILVFWMLSFKPTFSLSSSVQFSSVAQSCPTLYDPINHSTPGLPVHHQLPEFTQTHVHRVSDAIQPSHPPSSPSPPAPNPSQHQSLFQWVNFSREVAKVLEFQL